MSTKWARLFHIHTSMFFLPMALLFVISGLAFFLGVKSESGAEIKKWQVPFVSAKQELDFLLNFLKQNKIPLPSKIEPRKRREALIIGTAGYEINLSSQGNTSTITSIKRNFLGVLMQIHKGRAGKALVVLGFAFGVFLCLFYASGLLMALKYKNLKGIATAFILGCVVLALLIVESL
ncbi:PepSY domain-containing protein [Helicobacter suis]|uniref:Integral membrane protein n=1 Tax=Helicobacter suis HS5 TaxID=710394 RepID=E7G4U9_9HELI|nr:PepSY domain-containing protein [Helicobacter suis]EFX41566.1 hypothetical protein HSUHS5_1023 [Helicobacter suis HS5]EFX42992.1 Conserved hypothetical integral membrane protein [Helicobacter suis HS1]BCD47792.1 hypothetical protein NHP194003_09960 [Helicobacter suis]BDR28857.1 hypothetical protein HSHS1_16180 [Helicobacter suis HS1]